MSIRAQAFTQRLQDEFVIHIEHRSRHKIQSIFRFFGRLLRIRPNLCYVFDMGFSGVLAAALYRLATRCHVIVDTGDAIYELSRSSGNRSRMGLWLTRLLERTGFGISDRVVVRSHPHQDLLKAQGIQADVIPDGVDTSQFTPAVDVQLRQQFGLDGYTVIGLLGSLVWSPRLEMCYGWELVEVIARLKNRPVKGLIIGDGSGLEWLKERCAQLGIADRVVFAGRRPYDELGPLVSLMDICLSTQTNDIPGQVRTTGKLPIYLACGRFVLSSQVGEAALVLPPEMLVPYHGTKDTEYPARLAARIETLLDRPESLARSQESRALAQKHFDYNMLSAHVRETIRRVLDLPAGENQGTSSEAHAMTPDRRLIRR